MAQAALAPLPDGHVSTTSTAFTACTTLALRNGNMIQRCFRDSQAGNAHILTGEASYIEVGRILVGIEGATQYF